MSRVDKIIRRFTKMVDQLRNEAADQQRQFRIKIAEADMLTQQADAHAAEAARAATIASKIEDLVTAEQTDP